MGWDFVGLRRHRNQQPERAKTYKMAFGQFRHANPRADSLSKAGVASSGVADGDLGPGHISETLSCMMGNGPSTASTCSNTRHGAHEPRNSSFVFNFVF